jgi:hypothetical protein
MNVSEGKEMLIALTSLIFLYYALWIKQHIHVVTCIL